MPVSDDSVEYSGLNFLCKYIDVDQSAQILKPASLSKQITIYSHNIKSINPKFDQLLSLLDQLQCTFTVLALQEVWSVNREYNIPGYHPPIFATRDQNQTVKNPNCGGGVGVYISDQFNYTELTFENQFIKGIYESIWIKVDMGGGNSLILGNVYRPSSNLQTKIEKALEIHYNILNCIKTDPVTKHCKLYLVGDYNLDLLKCDENVCIGNYLDAMYDLGLMPCVTKPTRIDDSGTRISAPSTSLLDHIFCNSFTAKFAGVLLDGISDHFPVFLLDQSKMPNVTEEETFQRDMSNARIDNFCAYLKAVSWQHVLENKSPAAATDLFFDTLKEGVELSFPMTAVKKKVKKCISKLPWFTEGIVKSSKRKGKLFSKKKKFPTLENSEKYKDYKRVFNSVCRAAKKSHLLEQFTLHSKNCRATWKLINTTIGRQTKSGQNFPKEFKSGNHVFDSPEKIVNGFNDFFCGCRSKSF